MRRATLKKEPSTLPVNVIPISGLRNRVPIQGKKQRQEEVIAIEVREAMEQTRLIMESNSNLKSCLESTLQSLVYAIRIDTTLTNFFDDYHKDFD
ncbi:MAG: hypothetical protein A4E66_00150 [Syntrophus sp. PtaB.Bin001]|nr:MAG: hypothetical protein A4E66_00150 [Syntrophus sp. PtaB.Bin001]